MITIVVVLVTEGSDLDIVRELGFISIDAAGEQWRAEVSLLLASADCQ